MLPVLRAAADGEISAADLRERVAASVRLTANDLAEMLPSGRQTTFTNRTAWANVFLQRAGLLERARRGVYRISDEGRRVLAGAPERIDMRFLERYPAYVEWRQRSAAGRGDAVEPISVAPDTARTPEEQMAASHAALTSALEGDLLDRVREASPGFFESLIIDLLIAMGYGGGRAEMGRSEVQSFAGSLDGVGATKGIFVTTSSFSQGAREFVERIAKRIVLVDGAELARLMVEHKVGVRTRTTYELKKVDEDYFTE
jgi:restriction system protein